MKRSLYDIVGVPPVAPREMIASACRRRIAQLERQGGEAARAEIFARLPIERCECGDRAETRWPCRAYRS